MRVGSSCGGRRQFGVRSGTADIAAVAVHLMKNTAVTKATSDSDVLSRLRERVDCRFPGAALRLEAQKGVGLHPSLFHLWGEAIA